MNSGRCRSLVVLATVLASLVESASATSLQLSFAPPTSFNESNRQAILEWTAEPGKTYVIQSADALTPAPAWRNEDVAVKQAIGPVRWMAPEALRDKKYYRLVLPQPEVRFLEPAFINSDDTNALLYLIGQGLPTDGSVVINGQSFTTAAADSNGTWLAISPDTLPAGTFLTGEVLVLDNGSNVVAQLPIDSPILYGPEPTLEQLQGPPEEPPASPQAVRVYSTSARPGERINRPDFGVGLRLAEGGADDYDSSADEGDGSAGSARLGPVAVPRAAGLRHSVIFATGEVRCEETDLAVPGRGLDFAWTRTYRSRTGPNSAQGAGWDFSYDLSINPQPDGTVELRSGNGRMDTFYPNGTNRWVRNEWFVEMRDLNADGMPDVLFADGGRWLFNPDGTPVRGRISQIIDRNGNTIRCEYDDTAAQLVRVVDTRDRTNTIAYNPAGLIESVTDSSGRTVRYEYDGNGDLTGAVSPAVTGTPNGNDFPGGKTNHFSYTSGFADARLNHNLTSCTDENGQVWLQIAYQTNQEPSALDFDSVASLLRGVDKTDIRRGLLLAAPGSIAPHKEYAIVNDAVGNVHEYYYDSRHRLVTLREFTGRADPTQPTSETENRPTGKLRATDPDYFETSLEWNADSLCTRVLYPRGNSTEMVYEGAFNQNASRSNKRHSGDLRVLRKLACCDQDNDGDGVLDELRWTYEYDPRFGSPCGGITDWNIGDWAIYNGTGREETANSALRTGNGELEAILKNLGLLAFTAGGNVGINEPLPHTTLSGRYGRVKVQFHWDREGRKGDTASCFATCVTDPRGHVTTFEYDANGNCRRIRKRPDLLLQEWDTLIDYNLYGQVTTITNAADANGYRRVDTLEYYSSGPHVGLLTGLVLDDIAIEAAPRYQFEYDERGNVTRFTDANTNDWLFTYNQLDQCVHSESAAVSDVFPPIRIATDYSYDANNNLIRVDRENQDDTGKLDGINPQWTTEYTYDPLDRLTHISAEVEESPVGTRYVTRRFFYDGNDNVVAVQSPLAVGGVDPDNVVVREYDERDLLYRSIPAPGTMVALTNEFDYDGNTLLIRAMDAGGNRDSSIRVLSFAYDGLDRCVMVTDALSNRVNYAYDRNGNLLYRRSDGELSDGPGDAGNVPLAETTYEYDSFDRLVRRTESHFDSTTQSPLGDGAGVTTLAYAPNGQCMSATDDNGHTTRYVYDTVGRLTAVTDPKTNITSYVYDPSGNVLSITQSDRSDITSGMQQFTVVRGFDKLNRLTRSVDNVGNTNLYAYNSRDNLVRHTDPNGNLTGYVYDGLNRRTLAVADINGDGLLDIAADVQSAYEYDDNSRLHSQTDDNTNTTLYAYDSRNRCVSVTEADGTSRSLIWSPRSNLVLEQHANGTVISNSFDLLDRCLRRDITPGSGLAATTTFELFAYDGLSRLVLASNDVSRVEFTYDSLDNNVREQEEGLITTCSYDAVGNRLAMTYPSGRLVTYTYDPLDQVATVSSGAGSPPAVLATYAYDGAGRLGRITRANNVNTRYQWDGLVSPPNAPGDYGWVQVGGVNHQLGGVATILDRRVATYDRNQNRLSRSQVAPFFAGGPMTTNVFAYDALDRLTGFARGSRSPDDFFRQYVLDGNGNRQMAISNGLTYPYTMDDTFPDPADFQMNQYTLTPFVLAPELYDQNGNLVSWTGLAAQRQYVYDYADRLVEVLDLASGLPEVVSSYTYDALGRRIRKVLDPGTPTEAVWQYAVYAGGEVLEARENGLLRRAYIRPEVDDEVLVGFDSNGNPQYYQSDDLGNTLALTDGSGSVIERYEYDDYGAPHFLSVDGFDPGTNASPVGNPYLFHGMEWDLESGFYYRMKGDFSRGHQPDRAAYFDPEAGRYILRAGVPLRDGGNNENWPFGGSQLSFAGNNPWSPRDKSTGMATGKRTHGPIMFSSVWDDTDIVHVMFNPREYTVTKSTPWRHKEDTYVWKLEMDKKKAAAGDDNPDGSGLRKEEGGRHTPFHNKYRPQFRIADRAEVRVERFNVRQEFGPAQGSRRYQTISNVMKSRHESAKNAISNIR